MTISQSVDRAFPRVGLLDWRWSLLVCGSLWGPTALNFFLWQFLHSTPSSSSSEKITIEWMLYLPASWNLTSYLVRGSLYAIAELNVSCKDHQRRVCQSPRSRRLPFPLQSFCGVNECSRSLKVRAGWHYSLLILQKERCWPSAEFCSRQNRACEAGRPLRFALAAPQAWYPETEERTASWDRFGSCLVFPMKQAESNTPSPSTLLFLFGVFTFSEEKKRKNLNANVTVWIHRT